MEPVFFKDKNEFRKWLNKNHDKEKEILVGYYKKGTGKENMTWSESVDVALCFGWIDGIRKSIDAESYFNRFTPRRPGSNWSTINIKKVEALTRQGLMHPAGIAAFNKRKGSKSGVYSYENEPVQLPTEMEKLFKQHKGAWSFYKNQAPSYKKIICRWILDGKQEATRFRRLNKVISASADGIKIF